MICAVVTEFTSIESLQYDFNTIDAATSNFSADNKLGEGGFGAVYKVRTALTHNLLEWKISKFLNFIPLGGVCNFRVCLIMDKR